VTCTNSHSPMRLTTTRCPTCPSTVACVPPLGTLFPLIILVTFTSQLAYQARQVRASIGADISVDSPPLDSGFSANLTGLPEVAGATRVLSVGASPPYYYASVYALDPATFFAVTNPEPWYFRAIGPDAARQILATPGQVLVTETYLQNAFLAVGDRIPFQAP